MNVACTTHKSWSGSRWLALFFSMAMPTVGVAGPIPVEPPAPPWKDFVKTDGHANEIPIGWLTTEEGRFAHGLALPDTVPKTVPFDFTAARLRSFKPGSKSVGRQYWDHLCSTEAGSFILKPVDGVDGFFFMRPVGGVSEQENSDRWRLEAPGIHAIWGATYDPGREASAFVQRPSATFEWVDFAAPSGGVFHFSGYERDVSPMNVDRLADSGARYAVVWRGVHRERDREHAISGAEWIIFDRGSREVLGVLRDFYLTGSVRNRPQGISWLNAGRCPFKRKLLGPAGEMKDIGVWAPMVLRPKTYPGLLKYLDQLNRTATK
jgi:hypothetical protein